MKRPFLSVTVKIEVDFVDLDLDGGDGLVLLGSLS